MVDRPEQRDAGADDEQRRQWNQEQKAVHADARCGTTGRFGIRAISASRFSLARPMRSAFSTTTSELADMPMAASQGETRPSAASGAAARLYTSAQRRFWARTDSICCAMD